MAGLDREVRERTDCLDAAGNTTAAIGKGFAIGSAACVSVALFSAFVIEVHGTRPLELQNQFVFFGLFIGSVVPFVFSALLMTSVARAAQEMLVECYRQFPAIVSGESKPDYAACIAISTKASLREMVMPGVIAIATPVGGGFLLG